MSANNDDYRSDNDMSQSSIESFEDEEFSSQQFVATKNKKDLKKQKNLKKKKLTKQKFIESEASETSGEESEDQVGEISKKKRDEIYDTNLLKRRNQRNVVTEIENRYKDGGDLVVDEAEQTDDDQMEPPGWRDPKFWRVSCNRGKEHEAVTSIMFRHSHLLDTETPLEIVSVFTIKKFPGVIFFEAYFDTHVIKAIEGLAIVRQTPPELVEPETCLQIFKPAEVEQVDIVEGSWVRVRQHHIYQGDLARVMSVDQEKKIIKLKVVPRQKMLMKSLEEDEENKKKNSKKNTDQTRFQMKEEEGEPLVEETYQKGSKFMYLKRAKYLQEQRKYVRGPKIAVQIQKKQINDENDEPTSQFFYSSIRDEWTSAKKDGFEIISLPVHQILKGNVKPTTEELQFFYPDVSDYRQILQKMYQSLKQVVDQKCKIQVGDYITVDQEQYRSAKFKVVQVLPDENKLIVTKNVKDKSGEVKNYEYKLDISEARLAFKLYQQVTIISGPNTGLSGTIIKMDDKTAQVSTEASRIVEALLTDLQAQKNVIKKMQNEDVVDVVQDAQKTGFKRNDLVKFGQIDNDVGCILNLFNNEVTILDLTNQVKTINKLAIRNSINTRNNVVKNMYGNDIRQQDLVVVLDGFYKNNKATVLHVYRDYLFLFNGKFDNTQGVIIEKANNCGLVSSSKKSEAVVDTRQQVPNEDWKNLRGQMVTIRRGQWSQYRGMVQEVTSKVATIQLSAKNLTVKVPLEHIKSETSNPHLSIGKTPQHQPGMSTRVWDDLEGIQRSVMHGYQSPYVAYQTPMHD